LTSSSLFAVKRSSVLVRHAKAAAFEPAFSAAAMYAALDSITIRCCVASASFAVSISFVVPMRSGRTDEMMPAKRDVAWSNFSSNWGRGGPAALFSSGSKDILMASLRGRTISPPLIDVERFTVLFSPGLQKMGAV
jgi:hypothetical protein